MHFGVFTLHDHYPEDMSPRDYYRLIIDELIYAEELGFDSAWIGEHHFCDYICPSPPVFLAAVAERTKRIRLGTAVALPALRDPVLVAEEYAMLDVLSNGRMDLGIGRGFQSDVYQAFGRDYNESSPILAEYADLIERAWANDVLHYRGKYRQVDGLRILPRPVQAQPPIWMAGSRTRGSYQLAGERGYNLMMATVFTPLDDEFIELVNVYRTALRAAGHDPETKRVSIASHCYVGKSSSHAKQVWEKHYRRYMKFFASLLDENYEVQKNGQSFKPYKKLKDLLGVMSFEYARAHMALCGDVDECVERILKSKEKLGNTDFWIYADLGGLPREEIMGSLSRFQEVMRLVNEAEEKSETAAEEAGELVMARG